VHLLIEAGVSRKEAGTWVARRVAERSLQIALIGRQGLTAARVLRWRDNAGIASSQAFNDSFKTIIDGAHKLIGPHIDRSAAEIAAESILQVAANWGA
jgi:hypothetical protein